MIVFVLLTHWASFCIRMHWILTYTVCICLIHNAICIRSTRTAFFSSSLLISSLSLFPSVRSISLNSGNVIATQWNTNCKCNSGRSYWIYSSKYALCSIIYDKTFVCVFVNLQQTYAHLFQFLLLDLCAATGFFFVVPCTISLFHDCITASAFGWRFYWWFTYQGIAQIHSHTHTHAYKTQCAWLLHFIILFAKLISVPFLSLTFSQVRVTIIMSSACTYVCICACACAHTLCSMFVCWIERFRLHGVFSIATWNMAQELLHFTCWLFYYIGFIFISTAFPELCMLHCLCELHA